MIYEINARKILALILCIIIITEFSGCIDINTNNGGNKTGEFNLRIATGDDTFKGFHPWMESLNYHTLTINSNVFNSLVEFDEIFQIIPALAESWNNPDNLTWRFNLRKGVKFHNGYNLTAEDVKYSVELIKEDKNNTLYNFLTMVQEIVIIEEFIVEIVTSEPYPLLLNKLVYGFIISKQYHEEITDQYPVGTGPYRFSEYINDTCIVLERFDEYWKEKPKFHNVTIKFFDNYEEQINAFLDGHADIIDNVAHYDYDELSKQDGIKILPFTINTVTYLSFDFRENDSCCFPGEKNPVSNVRVRKAIYHSIDIDEIIEKTAKGNAEPASQFVTSYIIGYNPELERLSYNLEKARQYMKDAGYENGFEITLDCRQSKVRENASKIIANQLSEINITVEINILTGSDFYNKISHRNSSFYFVGWQFDSCDAGEIFDNILRTVDLEGGFGFSNFGYYSNPDIDSIADDICYNMKPKVRLNLMQEGFAIAMDDVACIPLYILNALYGMIDEISWQPRADGLIKLEDIDIGYKY